MPDPKTLRSTVDKTRTRRDVRAALKEVRQAARPDVFSLRSGVSLLVALAAGGLVAWRGVEARLKANEASPRPIAPRPTVPTQTQDARPGKPLEARAADRPKSTETTVKATGIVGLGKEFLARFNDDECAMRAQSIAFVGILSLIPVLLFALAAMGFFVPPEHATRLVHELVAHILPGAEATKAADQVIQQTGLVKSAQQIVQARGWALGLGILSLVWAGMGIVSNAIPSMNAAWEVKETRSFVPSKLISLGVFLGGGFLFLLSLLPSSGPDFIQNLHIPSLGLPKHPPFLVAALMQIGFELLALGIDIALFVLIYRALPNIKVTWRAAMFGGVITGFVWEFLKKAFAIYLAHFASYNKLYGAFGGLVLLVTWILYSCMTLLAGAILCKMYQEHSEEGGVAQKASGGDRTA
jgi:membrane protein